MHHVHPCYLTACSSSLVCQELTPSNAINILKPHTVSRLVADLASAIGDGMCTSMSCMPWHKFSGLQGVEVKGRLWGWFHLLIKTCLCPVSSDSSRLGDVLFVFSTRPNTMQEGPEIWLMSWCSTGTDRNFTKMIFHLQVTIWGHIRGCLYLRTKRMIKGEKPLSLQVADQQTGCLLLMQHTYVLSCSVVSDSLQSDGTQ